MSARKSKVPCISPHIVLKSADACYDRGISFRLLINICFLYVERGSLSQNICFLYVCITGLLNPKRSEKWRFLWTILGVYLVHLGSFIRWQLCFPPNHVLGEVVFSSPKKWGNRRKKSGEPSNNNVVRSSFAASRTRSLQKLSFNHSIGRTNHDGRLTQGGH